MNLIGADTNILVRFLVRDVESQAKRILVLLDKGHVFYINVVVLTELYWVLTKVYHYPKNSFVAVVDMLLESNGFQLFDSEIVRSALSDYIHNTVEFPDCLIHQINLNKEMITLTFDKKSSGLSNMQLLNE